MNSNIRTAVLAQLDSLPNDQSIQPPVLAKAVGLAPEQVNTFLATVKEKEVIILSDGSIKLHPNLKGQFKGYIQPHPPTPVPIINAKDIYNIMSNDTYNIPGQAAAVGPGAQATGNIFHQAWQQHQAEFDLKTLASELSQLRAAMKGEGTEAEHDAATGEVAKAEAAAKSGDGSGMLQHLKAAGKWAYGIAEKIGVAIAAKAIGKALGITP